MTLAWASRWRKPARAAALLLALGLLAAVVREQWDALLLYEWRLSPGWVLAALAGLGVAWLVEIDTWRRILAGLGGVLRLGHAFGSWFLGNIMRYVPGNIWQYLGMAELNAAAGVSRILTLTSIVLHQVIWIAAGLAIVTTYAVVAGELGSLSWLRPVLWLAPLGLILLQPRRLERMLNWALVRLRREPVRVTLTGPQILGMLMRYAVVWTLTGLGFAALVRGLTAYPVALVPRLAVAWVAAYAVGFLSLLTPSGLGVREGALILLLSPMLAPPLPAIIAILARLWMMVGELSGVGVVVAARFVELRRLPARSGPGERCDEN